MVFPESTIKAVISPEGHAFVPPTTEMIHSEEQFAHLKVDENDVDRIWEGSAFAAFDEYKEEFLSDTGETPEHLTIRLQKGTEPLNGSGRGILVSRIREEKSRHDLKQSGEGPESATERAKILFGVEIDFGEEISEERMVG